MTSALDRLVGELWPADDVDPGGPGGRAGFELHGVIEVDGSLLVLPFHDRRACMDAVTRWTDAITPREALARSAARAALMVLGSRVIRSRRIGVRVVADDPSRSTLHEYLATVLGTRPVALSVNLGSTRPNQKPLVRIHGARGKTLGFAKIAWNDLTRSLVENEEAFLREAAHRSILPFRIPQIIHSGLWDDRYVAVTSPLLGGVRLPRSRPPAVGLVEAIAAVDGPTAAPLAESRYRKHLDEATAALRGTGGARVRAALDRLLERWGDVVLTYGRWHGDFTPWNTHTGGQHPIVWDWERTAPDRPVGFDVVHWAFNTRLHRLEAPSATLAGAVQGSRTALSALGVSAQALPALARLYALEMHLRFAAEGPAGPWWVSGLFESVMDGGTP